MSVEHHPSRQSLAGVASGKSPLLVPIPEAGNLLGVKRTSIYNLLADGKLKGVRLGGRRLITMTSIRDLVSQLEEGAA